MHQDLIKIAQERSPERRLQLMRIMTDMYFDTADTRTEAEVYLFNDIMEKIVDSVSRDVKAHIAANFATLEGFPRSVVHKLASDDDIDVARPVIRDAASLTDEDLVDIARTKSQAHLTVIAQRETLSEKVTDVLIDRGDTAVVSTVSGNHGARISSDGIAKLLDKARYSVDLCEVLVERPDLSQATVERLIPLVSESLVVKLAERGYEVGDALPPDVLETVRRRFRNALQVRKENILQVSVLIEEVRKGRMTLDAAVTKVADDQRLLDAASIIGEFARLDRNYALNLILRGKLQTVLILFRSLGLSFETLDAVLAVRAMKLNARYATNPSVRRDYEAIDSSVAQRVIRFIKVRQITAGDAATETAVA